MKIFDAHISGSLSVSSSAHIEGDLTVLGTLFATVSGTTTNALTASEAPRYTLTSSFHSFTSSYTTGSFTGSFIGDGGNLYNIPASGVTGLNLNKITSGSVSASISPDRGLEVNTDLNVVGIITAKEIHTSIVTSSVLFESGSTIFGNTSDDTHQITGSVGITGSLTLNNNPVVVNTTFNSFTSSANGRLNSIETSTSSLNSFTSSADGRLSSIEGVTGSIALLNTYTGSNNTVIGTLQTSTSSLNSFTSSIDTTIKNKLNSDNVISGSAQVIITGTTGYSNFSSSIGFTTITIENRVGSLETESGSIRTDFNSYTSSNNGTNTTQNNRLTAIETSTGSLNTFTSSANGRLNSLESTSGALNTYTSSANGRLNSIETSTGSLNSFSSSTLSSLTAIHTSTGSLNTFSSSTLTRLTNLESASSSIRSDFNSHTSSANGRLNSLEISTGSLNTFTSSANGRLNSLETTTGALTNIISTINGRLNTVETSTGSLNSFSSSTLSSLTAIHTSTGSLNTFSSSTNTRLSAIETSTGSLNSYTSSNTTNINAIHTATSSLNSYTSSNNTTLGTLQTATGALNTFSSSANTRLNAIETSTSSLNSYTSSNTTNINAIHTATSSLNSYTSSNNTRLGAIETSTSSLNSFTSSINTTIKSRLNTEGVISGSAQVTISNTTGYSTFSSSLATTDLGQDNRLTSLEGKTGSYATTGSNVFQGDQTITGSLYISQNLIIGGSSSIQHITSSQLNIGDNIITVNAQNPSIRFGGLAVIDSGSSPQVSGSILFDSVNNQWIFVHQNQSTVTSSVLLMGPETYNNLGGESYIAQNKIIKSTGIEHLAESNITDTGTKVSINSNTEITGTFTVGGGGKIIATSMGGDEGGEILLGKPATNTTIAGDGVTIDVFQNRLRIFEQGGSVRGAYLDITSLGTGVSTKLNGTADTASYVEYSNVANKPSLVSGSSQITFLSISSIPSGLVSGSSQVLNGSGVWSGSAQLPSGVVSGSSQITFGSISSIPSGLVSGSSQITFGSISSIPSGLVSGSSQIAIASTSGFGTYLNQAVLTTSTPTFDYVITSNNANGTNIRLGDDTWIGDINIANTFRVTGLQDATQGYIVFGNSNTTALGRSGTGALTYGGNTIWHAGNDGSGTGLDADLLDGSHASAFSPVAGSSSITTVGTISSGTWNGSSISTTYTDAKVTSVSAGTGISVNATTGAVTVTNTGTLTVAGTANQVLINGGTAAANGNITLSLPQSLGTGSSPTFAAITVGKSGTDSTITFPAQTNDPGYIKHYESNNTAIMYFNVSDDTNDEFHFGYTADASTFRLRADGVVLEGTWQGSAIGDSYISSASNWNTAYNKRPSSLGFTSSTVTLTLGDGSTVTASVPTFNQNTTGNAGYATTAGALTSMNISQFTNNSGYITSYTETDTLSSVTARGASTSTAISINNTLTVTSGRLIVRTGGANTYGIVSGYDNSNHLMTFRADIAGATSSPTLTAGHQMCFVEYAEANDTTGWFFKSSSTGTYQEIARITRSTFNYNGNTVLHSSNYNSYSPTLTGTGASGTWGINITGNAATLGNISASGFWQASGSWGADLTSNGYTRQIGIAYTGGEFSILTNNAQISTLIDGTYFAGEQGGFYSMNSSNQFSSRVGFNRDGSGNASFNASIVPTTNGTLNLGSSSARWNTVFTSDLSMSNGIGDYTIVEGEEDLFIYNNKTNKVFKFLLQEVDSSIVPAKKI